MAVRKIRTTSKASTKSVGIKYGFRSGLEETVAAQLEAANIQVEYEGGKIPYTTPPKNHNYTWDFKLPNGIIIETKGRFLTADRQKHLLIKAQHPELDIRFVFSNSRSRISKLSATTYQMWCIKHGFLFSDKLIPEAWLKERKRQNG